MTKYPDIIEEFTSYKLTIQNRSLKTIEQYKIDLTLLFKYLKAFRNGIATEGEEFAKIDISDVDLEFVRSITTEDLLRFFTFVASTRNNHASTRARKLSSIKSFFKYICITRKYFENNPAASLDAPKKKTSLPKFLSLDESILLLDTVRTDSESKSRRRDYAIITLFLNCGMRLSELVGINLSDIDRDMRSLRVVGKGNKERIVYLNVACRETLKDYLEERKLIEIKEKNALFLSSRGTRISNKTVQWVIYKYLDKAGLGYRHLSVHKLRHTAATLMYRNGGVDVRVLKDILGHEQLNTTQIYTHVSNESMEEAMAKNPLASQKDKK